MKKCRLIADSLLASYHEKSRGSRFPKVISSCGTGRSEGFELNYAGGTLAVKAQSPLAEVYALSLLHTIIPSGHWQEFLGLSSPRFALRPLWLCKEITHEENVHFACQRAIELGYNAIAWRGEAFHEVPGEYGLKYISVDNENSATAEYLLHTGKMENVDECSTLVEMALEEMRQAESRMPEGRRLIYYLPYKNGQTPQQTFQLILTLSRECLPTTCLAFPSVAGDPKHDHLEPHPFWDASRHIPQLFGVELLPVFNAGCVFQGEGLWPGIAFDQMELLLSGCRRHSFAGAMGLTNALPKAGGFLDANLWMMGQIMWRKTTPGLLLETWMRTYKHEQLNAEMKQVFKDVRRVILSLSKLRWFSEERLTREEILYEGQVALISLSGIELRLAELEKKRFVKTEKITTSEYLKFFLRDSRRLLKLYVPTVNIDDDPQESIWTKICQEGTNGRKVVLLDQPNAGHPHSRLNLLYQENR